MSKKVLITGATGNIATLVISALIKKQRHTEMHLAVTVPGMIPKLKKWRRAYLPTRLNAMLLTARQLCSNSQTK